MKRPPVDFCKMRLSMKAVHIQCLNEDKEAIKGAFATGFIVHENGQNFLLTCWHVVTGFDMHNVEVGRNLPNRKFLEINLQNCTKQPGIIQVGGNQSTILPLYDENNKPVWYQDVQDVPNHSLNNINLKVPFGHDAVRLLLPESITVFKDQLIKEDEILKYDNPIIGDKLYIVGYPYGYSALGIEQPTPIVLTRFVAADRIKDRYSEMLLDGPGAPGMSGGPVFLEYYDSLLLVGIYTGLIYPDYSLEKYEKTTALGTMSNLSIWWSMQKIRK